MQILTVDIGTGTQDILLFDSDRSPENCLKLVMPSPTLLVAPADAAGHARRPAAGASPGSIMGGRPCSWAVEGHRRAGLPVSPPPGPARTFNDDLDQVRAELGVRDRGRRARRTAWPRRLGLRSGRASATSTTRRSGQAFAAFGLDLRPDALALAVFDHGAAPPGVSDRQFRMDYLTDRLRAGERRLSALAHRAEDVPPIMTRLAALARRRQRAGRSCRVVVMDTAPAAVLGALEDARRGGARRCAGGQRGQLPHPGVPVPRRAAGAPVRAPHRAAGRRPAWPAWLRALADGRSRTRLSLPTTGTARSRWTSSPFRWVVSRLRDPGRRCCVPPPCRCIRRSRTATRCWPVASACSVPAPSFTPSGARRSRVRSRAATTAASGKPQVTRRDVNGV